ncbi:hypothetical protein [Thiohalobacter sp.]|uniref:hypothetical protein n=1 Tax=Thiohalobacter sp. TaxID=2025948 RepID=UPI002613C056|nr:hypothetical protein [Thiohalobacter sp.]
MKRLLPMLALAALVSACIQRPVIHEADMVVGDRHNRVEIRFSDRDRVLIRDYYRRHLPPGLAKKSRLPPGLRKQLYRHGELPPGLQGRGLPAELERRLTRLPDGYVRIRVGTDVVLMDRRTRVVLDIIRDIGD